MVTPQHACNQGHKQPLRWFHHGLSHAHLEASTVALIGDMELLD
ncbi:hypothetical protein SAMN04515695_0188 [Pseudovibrio sp. Tun.PSC04-5.I4]|nr:hypothetical protein SAMN04515695_0188 [Pseudovibrio sp. Tun.PSC04-5.I4]